MQVNILVRNSRYLLIIILLALSGPLAAKDKAPVDSNTPFHSGTKLIGFYLGTSIDNYANELKAHPVPTITYDQGAFDNVGIGNIGIGGIAALKVLRNNYQWPGNYHVIATSVYFGLRGTYHFTYFKNKEPRFDPYAGIMLGVKVTHSNDTWYQYTFTKAYAVKGIFAGARYTLNDRFSLYSEIGYDISFITIGIYAKL